MGDACCVRTVLVWGHADAHCSPTVYGCTQVEGCIFSLSPFSLSLSLFSSTYYRIVPARRHDPTPVGRKHDRRDPLRMLLHPTYDIYRRYPWRMMLHPTYDHFCHGSTDGNRSIFAGSQDDCSAWRERSRSNYAGVVLQLRDHLSRLGIDDGRRIVVAGCRDSLSAIG